jgi:NAD+ synthase (glutamine-hydrolysing)
MKIAIAQLNFHVGNFDFNFQKISNAITQAKQSGADLVVFSEMSVCGYPSGDFLEFKDYIDRCYASIEQIRLHCQGIAAIVGGPDRNPSAK